MKSEIVINDSSGILKYSLVGGAVLLCAYQFFISPIHQSFSIFLLAFTLLFFGLPHGALDHRVAKVSANNDKWSLADFLKNYFLKIFITCVIWLLSPSAGFISFLLFSGYHFGETDLCAPEFRFKPKGVIITLYGTGIVGCLLIAHIEELWNILDFFSPVFAANNTFTLAIDNASFLLWLICFFVVCLISVYCFANSKSNRARESPA